MAMDPATTPLGQMLLEEITPVVMLLSTPSVEQACLKNGLSFLHTLTPFCSFNNIDVPVRTASDQPYRLHKFKLRLFYASDVRKPDLMVAKEQLKQVITEAGDKMFSESRSDVLKINHELLSSEYQNTPSWFQFLNKELVRVASFSDHEAFDHPVICLLAVSSKDEQPINRFVDLFNTNKLPSLLNDGAMDPKISKHYLLVHDNQDGSTDRASKIFTEMRNTFGTNDCSLLCINSSLDAPIKHQDNPWALYISDASPTPSQDLGCFLNIDDINEIKDLMQDLSSKHIIPNMEQKIRVLNQQVSATRKGFKNQIKNLWWRKGKEDGADSLNGPTYNFNSIESQIRVLGDYAFMLRDYELALSNYRLISTDYKIDKAWKRYAGVQEMMGLTYFMLDQSRKEAEYCMENAFTTYLKLGSLGQLNATRCGLWWIEMLKARDEYKEAATVYFRICGEDILHSAVMLEQASHCYLLSKPSMLRKYGFHLVLSGEQYKKCDQIKHAIRTYKSALSVFKGTTWSYINDHVHFHIGQWYASLGMYDVAVKHMMEILACSHQSKTTQELFLGDFLQIVEKTGRTFEVTKLQLPIINISSLKVIFEDYRTFGSPSAVNTREGLWQSLEEEMLPSFSAAKTNWLELQSKLISQKNIQSNVCVADEAVKVNMEFKNPLQISIPISGVTLICKHSDSTDEVKYENESSVGKDDEADHFRNMSSDNSSFMASEVDFLLGGGETTMIQLSVTPRAEGTLEILGVRWKLSGTIVGFHNFELSLPKRNAAKGRRKTKCLPNEKFKFVVIKSIPKLQGSIHPLPGKAYAGDLQRLVLELRNTSEFPVKNLKMKISHPRFLIIGEQENMKSEFPACLRKNTDSVQCDAHANSMSDTVFLFPEGTSVQGETPLLWPLWFRAAVPGDISLYMSIYYEMVDVSSVIKYRTLRLHYNVQVLPSLDVSFQISPSRLRLQEFLVRMDVVNKTTSESFQVYQLSSVGQHWEISLLQPPDTIFPSQSLMAGQAISCFFTLKNSRRFSALEDNISTLPVRSDVRLVPQSSDDLVYDINSAPLINFHHYERLQQEVSYKGELNTVDFVLISRPFKSNNDPGFSDPLHVMSHHACHSSIASSGPISWLVDGPQTLHHDFSASFCEISLKMHLYNSSGATAFVRIDTLDSAGNGGHKNIINVVQSTTPDNQAGWHDITPVNNEHKVTSPKVFETQPGKALSFESVSPYIWSGSSSTNLHIEGMSLAEIPLEICVFSPGTYDLSNYVLNWRLPSNGHGDSDETRQHSGKCQGYKHYITVLQST